MKKLLTPMVLNGLQLPNRIAMAPLTRCRADANDVPQAMSTQYYTQRASAGLIITEATNISSETCSFERAPGIYSQAQIDAWHQITDSVHQAGGRIFMQLWHCGRVGSEAILHGNPPLSPSGINDDLHELQVYGLMANGRYAQIAATPSRAMTVDEIQKTVADYALGTANALKAGCDGIEIHAANGYLIHQFLSSTLNQRTDEYGGSLEGRLRLLREVIEATLTQAKPAQVGLRISPFARYNNARDANPAETFAAVAALAQHYGLTYLHLGDTNAWAGAPDMPKILETVKPHYHGCLIGNGGIEPDAAEQLLQNGALDMVAFGRAYISNPDLPERIATDGPYNEPRYVGWYGGTEEGYTDYPAI